MILYTQDCPKCEVLKKKLMQKNLSFETSSDFSKLVENNIDSLPVLEVDENLLEFSEAIKYVNNFEGEN